jgi:hypothetical protein
MVRVLLAVIALLVSLPARADDLADCFAAHEQAQKLRSEAKLLRSREELAICNRGVCPDPVRQDCALWLDELTAAQPTLIILARDATTKESMREVRVLIDGALVSNDLTGRALPVDPGERQLRLEARDGRIVEKSLLITEGDKGRRLTIVFPPSKRPPPPKPAEDSGPPVAVWVLGALGAAGIIGFAVLAPIGFSEENRLADECEPNCAEEDIDGVRNLYIAADVLGAFGVVCGAAALTVGLIDAFGGSKHDARLRLGPTTATFEARW